MELSYWTKCTMHTKIISFMHVWGYNIYMWRIHIYVTCCFRRGRLAVLCVGKCSSAPPPSPLICSYIQTPGPTPASTVAKASTRSLTWRNTPSYTPVGSAYAVWLLLFFYIKVHSWHHLYKSIKLNCSFIFNVSLMQHLFSLQTANH